MTTLRDLDYADRTMVIEVMKAGILFGPHMLDQFENALLHNFTVRYQTYGMSTAITAKQLGEFAEIKEKLNV